MTTKSVLVLSDIHVGSRVAVSVPKFIKNDGSTYEASKVQKALFQAWLEVATKWPKPDVLVINGEPVDGQQPKDKGVGAWTTDFLDQIDASLALVNMFQPKAVYLTQGSNYHVMVDGVSLEQIYAEKVHAKAADNGQILNPELFLTVEDVKFNFAHHIPGSASGWMYRSTPPAKEMMLMQLNQSHKWPFDVMVRSHNHYFWGVMSSSKMAVLTPAWQLQTWFAYRKSSAGTVTDIGAVRFLVDGPEYKLEKLLYNLPEAKPARAKA
jgi:hypothetical protein